MPFNEISNCVKCTVNQSFRGQQCLNNLWFLHTAGAVNLVDLTALATGLVSFWATEIMPLLSDDLELVSVLARDYTAENGLELLAGSTGVSGGGGDAMPNNVAACVSVRTGLAGRHYRGRLYLGGIARATVSENSFADLFIANVSDSFNGITGVAGLAPNWQWVVVAQTQSNPTPPPAQIPIPGGIVTPVTNVVFVDNIVDSQRRRLPGRGK